MGDTSPARACDVEAVELHVLDHADDLERLVREEDDLTRAPSGSWFGQKCRAIDSTDQDGRRPPLGVAGNRRSGRTRCRLVRNVAVRDDRGPRHRPMLKAFRNPGDAITPTTVGCCDVGGAGRPSIGSASCRRRRRAACRWSDPPFPRRAGLERGPALDRRSSVCLSGVA